MVSIIYALRGPTPLQKGFMGEPTMLQSQGHQQMETRFSDMFQVQYPYLGQPGKNSILNRFTQSE